MDVCILSCLEQTKWAGLVVVVPVVVAVVVVAATKLHGVVFAAVYDGKIVVHRDFYTRGSWSVRARCFAGKLALESTQFSNVFT